MADLIRISNNRRDFIRIIELLLAKGRMQESRNGRTLEIQNLVIEASEVNYPAPNGIRPGYQAAIGVVEGLQLIAGISDSALTAQIQPNFRNFMEDNGKFWGAYGPRTAEQFPIIARRLQDDHDTRQAVITIWDPEFDALGGKKDHPCTSLFNFSVRSGKLNMTTYMRSCDAWWGWPYDFVQFAMVQKTLAGVLGIEAGTYTHHAASFHLYEAHWAIAERMVRDYRNLTPEHVRDMSSEWAFETPYFLGTTWEEAAERAFTTYRVVTQTLPSSELLTPDEVRVADLLAKRRAETANYLQVSTGVRGAAFHD